MSFDLEQLYDVSLDDYCKIHNTTIDNLINKTKIDINLLRSHLRELLEKDKLVEPITEAVERLLDKKRKHLKRLEEWKNKKI